MKNDTLLVVAILVGLWFVTNRGCDAIPAPGPAPIPGGKLRVLILEESATPDRATALVLNSPKWRDYLKSKSGEFRIMDDDIPASELFATPEPWKSTYERAKTESKGVVPWIMASDGVRKGTQGPLPKTEDEMLNVLKSVGGEQ